MVLTDTGLAKVFQRIKSFIASQLNSKASAIHTHTSSEITDLSNGYVNLSTAQSIGGQKIFSHGSIGLGRDINHFASIPYGKNAPPANISYQYIWFGGNTASQGFANNWYSGYFEQRVFTNGSAQGRWLIRDTSESSLGIELFVNGSDKQFRPQGNNITDLGTSTNKWKSFNGINPGALSLPNPSNTISLDTTNWDLTDYSINSYTPPADGWIMLGGYADVIQIDGLMNYGITVNKGYDGYCEAFLPVLKGYSLRCRFRNCTRLNNAKFYPCQGNV